jgi:XTP/dITP diphosphohydrolase
MKLVIGTGNIGKFKEIQEMFKGTLFELLSASEYKTVGEPEEHGNTYLENACIKAKHYSVATGYLAIADDSGLEIDAIDGKPGILSNRFFGQNLSGREKCAKLLDLLREVDEKNRSARFKCVAAIAENEKILFIAEGVLEGLIHCEMKGKNGFGFDPVFYLPLLKRTLAELSDIEKNNLSHRAQAMMKIKHFLLQKKNQSC